MGSDRYPSCVSTRLGNGVHLRVGVIILHAPPGFGKKKTTLPPLRKKDDAALSASEKKTTLPSRLRKKDYAAPRVATFQR